MKTAILSLLVLLYSAHLAASPCTMPKFTEGKDIKLAKDRLLIVTHPSTQWDGRFSSKAGMDATVEYAKKNSIPVVYLQDRSVKNNATYFFADCRPDYWHQSGAGEFSFEVPATHVYTVGGHLELCQETTMKNLMGKWSHFKTLDLKITHVLDGIYMYGEKVFSKDPYLQDFKRFIEIVSFRNPRDRWYVKKLNALEMMGIIKDKNQEFDFLKRHLDYLEYFANLKDYQVILTYNDKSEVFKSGPKKDSPVLTIEWVDTLYTSGHIPVSAQ